MASNVSIVMELVQFFCALVTLIVVQHQAVTLAAHSYILHTLFHLSYLFIFASYT